MPQTRIERVVAFVGLAVIAAIVILLVPAWHSYHSSLPTAVTTASEPAPPTATHRQTVPTTPAPAAPLRPPAGAVLVVAATRGDCWLSARSGSSTGRVLYEGMLPEGRSVRVAARRLWLRFGAAANVDVTLNRKRVADLPFGTFVAVATRRGLLPTGSA